MSVYQRRVQDGKPLFDEPEDMSSWQDVRVGEDAARQETGYRIVWEYTDTGRVAVGQYVYGSLEVARAVAQAMDALWPDVRHRAVAARDVRATPSPGATPETMVQALASHSP